MTATTETPPVEDVTGKPPEAKVSKTGLARDVAANVLKKAGKPMKMDAICAAVLKNKAIVDAGVAKGTISVQVGRECVADKPRIKRVERSTYAHIDVKVTPAPAETPKAETAKAPAKAKEATPTNDSPVPDGIKATVVKDASKPDPKPSARTRNAKNKEAATA